MNVKRKLALNILQTAVKDLGLRTNNKQASSGFVCTCVVKRPPVEDILSFLQSEDWIVQNMFAGLDLEKVAHGLAG